MPRRPTRSPVHPRIRGERGHSFTGALPPPGSSPHTRGTPGVGRRVRRDGRFIPAYAGNARPRPCASCAATVHPRIRGERLVGPIAEPPCLGSSPHTRGTLFLAREDVRVSRFIPAYAGNAGPLPGRIGRAPVHPRIRGERPGAGVSVPVVGGSSPHTRGTRFLTEITYASLRFIPAYAGNAAGLPDRAGQVLVHPRIRGERTPHQAPVRPRGGSSPHTRGTRAGR